MNADEAQKCLLVAQRLLAQANTAEISRNQETSLDVVAPGKAGKILKKQSGSSLHVIWVYSTFRAKKTFQRSAALKGFLKGL